MLRISIEGDLTFTTVLEHAARHQRCFEKNNGTLVVDLQSVKRSDSAGLALLITWLRQAKRADKSLQFLHPPRQMMAMARVCGLAELLPFIKESL